MYDTRMTLKFTQYDDGEPEEITLKLNVDEFIVSNEKGKTKFNLKGMVEND